jgi:hypothetical protein
MLNMSILGRKNIRRVPAQLAMRLSSFRAKQI